MNERNFNLELPEKPTLSEGHFVISDGVTYSVDKLIEIGKSQEPKEIPLTELQKVLELECWSDSNGRKLKPIEVLEAIKVGTNDRPELSEHVGRVKNSNLNYPILAAMIQGELVVLDGMHRLVKSFLKDDASALVIKFEAIPKEAKI